MTVTTIFFVTEDLLRIEIGKHILNALLMVFLVFKRAALFIISGSRRLITRVLQLAIPSLLKHGHLRLTKVEPALHPGPLLDRLLVHRAVFLVIRAVQLIQLLLRDVLQLEGDLGDLAHVHATSALARRVVELSVALQLRLHELLHRFEVFLIEHLSQQVENQERLLVRNGAELERANHVKHCLDHLFPEGVIESGSHLHGAALGEHGEDGAQLFHCANPQHASLSHGSRRLVSVGDLIATTKDKHAVVADVDEVGQETI